MLAAPVRDEKERSTLRNLGASLLTFVQEDAQRKIVNAWKKFKTRNQIDEDTENAKILDLEEQLEEALEEIEELKHYEKSIKSDRDKWDDKYWILRSITSDAMILLEERMHNSCGGDEDAYEVLEKRLGWIDMRFDNN